MVSVHCVYASTSGHTEFVVETLRKVGALREAPLQTTSERAEQSQPEDLLKGDVLILASGTWNTGGAEGQLNPHMHILLRERAKDVDLKGKKVAVIGLGDSRYHFTCHAADHLEEFVRVHNGILIEPTLRLINEPYGQEKIVQKWFSDLLSKNYKLQTKNS